MTALEKALEIVQRHEGRLTDDPHDPGGITNYGVSLRFLRTLGHDLADVDGDGDVDADDVFGMTWALAARIYTVEFWDRYNYGGLPEDVACKVFDTAVNTGPKQAHLILQRACRAASDPVQEDGILGLKTRASAAAAQPHILLACLRSEQAGFYRALMAKNPDF